MKNNREFCLSIAGFDPCAGAGVLADVKTLEQHNVYGLGVCSAMTWQNETAFIGLEWCSQNDIQKQIEPLRNYPVKAIKIGLIESAGRLEWLLGFLRELFDDVFIVWDPVLKASSGFDFHQDESFDQNIFSQIDLITPNANEYRLMNLTDYSGTAILLKGGHREQQGVDVLLRNDGKTEIVGEPFQYSFSKHGTGCVLSSAIAANIAKGNNLLDSCRCAKAYVEKLMKSNENKLGYHHE